MENRNPERKTPAHLRPYMLRRARVVEGKAIPLRDTFRFNSVNLGSEWDRLMGKE